MYCITAVEIFLQTPKNGYLILNMSFDIYNGKGNFGLVYIQFYLN